MMDRWKIGLMLAAALLFVCAASPLAWAEGLSGVVYKKIGTEPEFEPGVDVPLENVPVQMQERRVTPQGEKWIARDSRVTTGDGTFDFCKTQDGVPLVDGQGNPVVFPGEYRFVLKGLSTYVPVPNQNPNDPSQVLLPQAPEPKVFLGVIVVTNGVPEDMVTDEDQKEPRSRPLTSMAGTPDEKPAKFPLTVGEPESPEATGEGRIQGLVFVDRGVCDGLLHDERDTRAAPTKVRMEIVDPAIPMPFDTDSGANGAWSFAEPTMAQLEQPASKEIVLRISFQFPDSSFGVYVADPVTGGLKKEAYREITVKRPGGLFAYEPINLAVDCVVSGTIEGVVFDDKNGNLSYEAGTDTPRGGLDVDLLSASGAVLDTMTSGADGSYSFAGLEAGLYSVAARGTGNTPDPTSSASVENDMVTADIALPVAATECKDEQPCTEGPLHEVTFEAEIWVGDLVPSVAATAILYEDCTTREPLDIASQGYQRTNFPGAAGGYQDVVHIEDVRFFSGWGTIRVRLAADQSVFPDGSFGTAKRRIEVSLNGRRISACMSFRCDTVQAGSRFPGQWGPFRVLSTLSRETWLGCEGITLPDTPDDGGDAGGGDAGGGDAGGGDAGGGDAGGGDAGNGDAGNGDAGNGDAGNGDGGDDAGHQPAPPAQPKKDKSAKKKKAKKKAKKKKAKRAKRKRKGRR